MKRSDRVIIRFRWLKQKETLMYKRNNPGTKSQEPMNLKYSGRLFVSEVPRLFVSTSHENQQLVYKCRQLKIARKIHSSWFLTEHGKINKILHVVDIENLFDNLEEKQLILLLFNLMN